MIPTSHPPLVPPTATNVSAPRSSSPTGHLAGARLNGHASHSLYPVPHTSCKLTSSFYTVAHEFFPVYPPLSTFALHSCDHASPVSAISLPHAASCMSSSLVPLYAAPTVLPSNSPPFWRIIPLLRYPPSLQFRTPRHSALGLCIPSACRRGLISLGTLRAPAHQHPSYMYPHKYAGALPQIQLRRLPVASRRLRASKQCSIRRAISLACGASRRA